MRISSIFLICLVVLATFTQAQSTTGGNFVRQPVSLKGIGKIDIDCSMTDPNCQCWECYNSGIPVCKYKC